MDGVLERIDEDEEQKTDQSFFTDPENENEGAAAEMRSADKDKDEEDDAREEDDSPNPGATLAPDAPSEIPINDDGMANDGNEGEDSLANTVRAQVDAGFTEAEGAPTSTNKSSTKKQVR